MKTYTVKNRSEIASSPYRFRQVETSCSPAAFDAAYGLNGESMRALSLNGGAAVEP